MRFLRQSTSVDVEIGPIWSTSDGALKADLAYNASGINCDTYKNGTKADVTLANSAGDGYFRAGSGEAQYLLTLSTTHTNTIGRMRLTLSATGYYMKPEDFTVLDEAVYDVLFGTTAPSTYAGGDTSGVTTLLGRIVGTLDTGTHKPQSGDAYARIGVAGASLTAVPWNAAWDAEAQSECQDAITASGLATAAALATVAGYIDTEVAAILTAVDTEVATLVSELAKVPKSDSNVSWNATALAAIAGKILLRLIDNTGDGNGTLNERTVQSALRALRNKRDIAAGKVYKEDDTTEAWTFGSTTNAAADPITVVDPT